MTSRAILELTYNTQTLVCEYHRLRTAFPNLVSHQAHCDAY
jgi:hypothetical protein